MTKFILFLHILSAVGMGFYLLFPFLAFRIGAFAKQTQEGYVQALLTANRLGQILLVVQFLTGGYLIGKYKDSITTTWMIIVIVLILAVGALTGMLGGPLKRIVKDLQAGKTDASNLAKAKTFSLLTSVIILILVILMVYPNIFS